MTQICRGCRKPINPMFDSIARDEHGRAWHTPCMVKRVGAGDRGGDVDLLTASPALWATAKVIDRFTGRKR